jgi:hypothetical protein
MNKILNRIPKIKKVQEINFMMKMINLVFCLQLIKTLELDFVNNE